MMPKNLEEVVRVLLIGITCFKRFNYMTISCKNHSKNPTRAILNPHVLYYRWVNTPDCHSLSIRPPIHRSPKPS